LKGLITASIFFTTSYAFEHTVSVIRRVTT